MENRRLAELGVWATRLMGVLVLVVLIGFVAWVYWYETNKTVAESEESRLARELGFSEITESTIFLILVFDHPIFYQRCKEAIEQHAQHGLRWSGVPGWSVAGRRAIFSRWNKFQRPSGPFVVYGDEAEAQDASGNWGPVSYSCSFNPSSQGVFVELEPGKLPRDGLGPLARSVLVPSIEKRLQDEERRRRWHRTGGAP
jgi:hypothetical protein